MWELDHKEGLEPKNRWLWTVVLEKTHEFLRQQRDENSQSQRKSSLNIHWKDWCWNWSSNNLATWWEELTHFKRPWCRERLRAEEKAKTEDELPSWHHRLSGHESEQTPWDSKEQQTLACCSSWVTKSQTRLTTWATTTQHSNISLQNMGVYPWRYFVGTLSQITFLRLWWMQSLLPFLIID